VADGERMSSDLLVWYDRHRRTLPWRAPPGTAADPYGVWLSEIMLQQTTVATVGPYFEKFLAAWPDVRALATAPLDDVLKAWAGLGYYARARNLHKCAIEVAETHHGTFPDSEEELLSLPGIGPYTAAAIAAIAFDRRAAAVDGNVERVLSRYFAIETPLPDAKPEIGRLARDLVPAARCGDFAQALMDLGATVCAPRRANCLICPWAEHCGSRKLGIQDSLPVKRARQPKPTRYGVVFWVTRIDGAVLVRARPHKGLLGGMTEFPSTDWREEGTPANPAAQAPLAALWRELGGEVRHTFTHFHLHLDVWASEPISAADVEAFGGRWVLPPDLGAEALPTLMRKVAKLALDAQ
jgi:A/G-specific adenine glycosylase